MYHADNPLHYHIIASFNDPDPDRALRFRPFVYGSRRRYQAAPAEQRPRLSLRPGERVREAFTAMSRLATPWRKAAEPCCSSAGC